MRKFSDSGRGFTLVDILVGTFLILVVFLGIFAAYQLGLKLIGQSKNRITATAIATGELEKIRNLPYEIVGTEGAILPYVEGVLEATTSTIRNNIEYTVNTQIKYIVDGADGLAAPEDDCYLDYKRAEVGVSWLGQFGGEVKLITDVAPKNKVEEIASCTTQPGGILSVSVSDSYGAMVSSPLIEIINPITGEIVDSMQPFEGKQDFPLVANTYKVVVSKTGYSSSRTYGTDEVVTPEKPHPIVLEGEFIEISFAGDSAIDKVSAFSVDTLSPWGMGYFSDSFSDTSKVSEFSDLIIGGGEVILAELSPGQYKDSGFLISTSLSPENLISWQEFSFNDLEPTDTQIIYQILYFDGENWLLIPDFDLPNNSIGFGSLPLNLSGLDINTYSQLRIKAVLSTLDLAITPILYDWQVSWKNSQATPIVNAPFHLQGTKIIGTDSGENPVYKYSEDHLSGASGHLNIPNLEWDSYTFSTDAASNLDIKGTDPFPQPIGLVPDTNLSVILYLEAQNSLLITVQDIDTGEPIFSATCRLSNSSLGYDITQYTDENGQTYFIPLETGDYILEVQSFSFSNFSGAVSLSDDKTKVINLERIE